MFKTNCANSFLLACCMHMHACLHAYLIYCIILCYGAPRGITSCVRLCIWELFGDYLGTIWGLIGDYLGLFADYLGIIRGLFEDYLRTIWGLFGDYLGT